MADCPRRCSEFPLFPQVLFDYLVTSLRLGEFRMKTTMESQPYTTRLMFSFYACSALRFAPLALLALACLATRDRRALSAARTWMWCHSSILILRSAAFALTLLPAAAPLCAAGGYGCFLRILSLETAVAWLSTLALVRFFPAIPRAGKVAIVLLVRSVLESFGVI